jgi:hypothetical protein
LCWKGLICDAAISIGAHKRGIFRVIQHPKATKASQKWRTQLLDISPDLKFPAASPSYPVSIFPNQQADDRVMWDVEEGNLFSLAR